MKLGMICGQGTIKLHSGFSRFTIFFVMAHRVISADRL